MDLAFASTLSRLGGMPVRTNANMADTVHKQIRFPRSKKRRIRKNWRKQAKNWETKAVPWDRMYQLGGVLYMHPAMLPKVIAELNRQDAARGSRPET